jgi:serine/threonine protein kinase
MFSSLFFCVCRLLKKENPKPKNLGFFLSSQNPNFLYKQEISLSWAERRGFLRCCFETYPEASETSHYCISDTLGQGSNGTVFLVTHTNENLKNKLNRLPKLPPLYYLLPSSPSTTLPSLTSTPSRYFGREFKLALKMQMPVDQKTAVMREYFAAECLTLNRLPLHQNIVTIFHEFAGTPTDEMIFKSGFDESIRQDVFFRENFRSRARMKKKTQFIVMESHPTSLESYVRGQNFFLILKSREHHFLAHFF